MNRPEYHEAKAKLEAYCAYQERCTFEVQEKLKNYDLSEEEKSKLIKQLEADKFLDDERFARSYASGKFVIKSWGKTKIKSHLIAKRLSKELIEKGLSEIDFDAYMARAQQLATKKMDELAKEKNPWTRKQKVIRYLASKGFESGVIYEVLGDSHG